MRTLKLIILFLGLSSSLLSRQWVAKPGDDLQMLIDQMADGDQITILQGEYRGSLIIEKAIQMIGEKYPIIHGENKGNTIQITADHVSLIGLAVQGSGSRLLEDEAGIKIEGNDVEISECRITDNLHGIYVKGGNRIRLRNNFIRGRTKLIEALRGNGIHLWNTKENLVEGNEIERTRDGIYFSFADETKVINNHIHHLRYGLHYMYSDDNYFQNNIFEYNMAGAALMYSKRINFNRNIFAHNRGYSSYGILFQSCDFCIASDNLVIDNTKGLHFNASNYNEVFENDIVENDIAVQINASCEENKLYKNNFVENLSGLVADAEGFSNYWADEGKGNYWTDYKGYDLDNNMIGDIPHKLQNIFEYLEGDYPEIRLYLFSPAAQILEMAEKTLPILQRSNQQDPFPLISPVLNEEIPWDNFKDDSQKASVPLSLIFGLLVLSPIVVVWRFRT